MALLVDRLSLMPQLFFRAVFLALCVSALAALPACRTMEGLGRDLSHLGDKISSKAR
jgi:predicted small secreted protein